MTKRVFARPFEGVRDKEIYPTEFKPGDFCPPELVEAAEICEVLVTEDDGGETGKAKGKGRKSSGGQAPTGDGTGQTSGEDAAQIRTGEGTGQAPAAPLTTAALTGQTSVAAAAATGSDQGQA